MKISLSKLMAPKKPEPPAELVAPYTERAKRIFERCGLRETELVKAIVPHFGRILFDIGGGNLNSWSGGKPELPDTGYAPCTKGMLIAGSVGIGKTTAMQCIAATIGAEYLSITDLEKKFSEQGIDVFWRNVDRAQRWDLFVDDIGREEGLTNFGKKMPVGTMLYNRYELWQRHGIRTHLSTNLVGDRHPQKPSVEEMYGVRIRDRFREMFVPVIGNGKSMR